MKCYLCKRPVDGQKAHDACIERRNTRRAGYRKRGLCSCAQPAIEGTHHCPRCFTRKRQGLYPSLTHNFAVHLAFIVDSVLVSSRCCVTGLSLFTLRKLGEQLSVDRIDSSKGYIEGNMQLMTLSLNNAKGAGKNVPKWAIRRLLRKAERLVHDRHSTTPTQS